jgi:cytochrome P450
MLASVDEKGKPFSDGVIMGNLLTMLLAGEDTTAFTLGWTFISFATVRSGRRKSVAKPTR